MHFRLTSKRAKHDYTELIPSLRTIGKYGCFQSEIQWRLDVRVECRSAGVISVSIICIVVGEGLNFSSDLPCISFCTLFIYFSHKICDRLLFL